MQGIGHVAIVDYCKCPITQQIQPQGAPEGFACFEFFLTHHFGEMISDEYQLQLIVIIHIIRKI